jgi:hypothetical protein
MSRFDRWKRIATPKGDESMTEENTPRRNIPEPPVYEPGSAWWRLREATRDIELTGIVQAAEEEELALQFGLLQEHEMQDLAGHLKAIAQARNIHRRT